MSSPGISRWPTSQRLSIPGSGRILRPRHFPSYPYNITRAALYGSYMNVLLVFLPIGLVAGALGWADLTVFVLNFLAIVPLASLIAFSTRELSGSVGTLLGRLLKATLNNIFEVIVGVVAVTQGQILIAQSSLLGSMLFDSLLVLGSSVFFASMSVESLEFSKTLTNIMSSLILIASVSLIVPTTMSPLTQPSDQHLTTLTSENKTLILSRTIAILLLILFSIFVYFQMKTHISLFLFLDPPEDEIAATPVERRESTLSEDGHTPTLSPWAAGGILFTSTICLTLCINYLISTTDGLARSKSVPISKIFIGMVLIPIAGNIGKCVALVAISRKNKIYLVIRTILNSVLQISLLILPLLILLGWINRQPLMLNFDVFEAAVFLLAIIVVNYVVQDGKTNYFEGIMLIGTYIVVVVAFYIRPDVIEKNMVLKP